MSVISLSMINLFNQFIKLFLLFYFSIFSLLLHLKTMVAGILFKKGPLSCGVRGKALSLGGGGVRGSV